MGDYTAVFEQHGDWWVGLVEELPGAHTQEHTLDEARGSLKEAARLIIEANRDLARRTTAGRSTALTPVGLARKVNLY